MTDLPVLRSRIEALADELDQLAMVDANWRKSERADLRTVLALLAGPGEEEAARRVAEWYDSNAMPASDGTFSDEVVLARSWLRLAVRLEAEKRAREEATQAKAELAGLREKVLKLPAEWELLEQRHREMIREGSGIGSWPRDCFESFMDDLVDDAKAASAVPGDGKGEG